VWPSCLSVTLYKQEIATVAVLNPLGVLLPQWRERANLFKYSEAKPALTSRYAGLPPRGQLLRLQNSTTVYNLGTLRNGYFLAFFDFHPTSSEQALLNPFVNHGQGFNRKLIITSFFLA
jgi:hypothetical protein